MVYPLSLNVTTEKDKEEIRPTEIYDLFLGDQDHPDGDTVQLANYPDDISFFDTDGNAATYTAWALKRSAIRRTADTEIDTITIEADNVTEAMAGYAAANDLRVKRLVVRLCFRNLLSSADDAKIIFDGIIDSVAFEGNKCNIQVNSQLGTLKMETGRPFEIECYWRYGYIECNYDFDLFTNQFMQEATAGIPDDWTKTGSAVLTQEEKPFPKFTHWGHYIAKLLADTGEQVYQIVTAKTSAGKEYYASFWILGISSATTIKLFTYDDVSGTQYGTETSLSTGWKKYTIRKTFGAASTVRRVGIEATTDSETIYFDHTRLFEVFSVDAGSTTALIIDADRTEADNYWKRGWIMFLTGSNINCTRHILSSNQAAKSLALDYTLPNSPSAGDKYIIRRGCDKTLDSCENIFSNAVNYGGFHTIPLETKL